MTDAENTKVGTMYAAVGKSLLAKKFTPTQTDFGPTKDEDGFISNTPKAPVDVSKTYEIISLGDEIVNSKVKYGSEIILAPSAMGGVIVDTIDVEGGKCQIVNITVPDILAIVQN
jgi:hypothetical protein